MGKADTNPIFQHLTRTINPETLKTQVRIASGVSAVLVTLIFLPIILSGIYPGTSIPTLVSIIVYFVLLASLPAVAGTVSANVTHRAIHSESFELILLTRIAAKEMTEGFLVGIQARLRPVYAAVNTLVISAAIWCVVTYFVYGGQFNSGLFVIVIMVVLFPWMLWVFVREWVKMGVLAGLYVTLRNRNASIGGVSAIPPSAIVLVHVIWLALILLCPVVTLLGVGTGILFLFAVGTLFGLPFLITRQLTEQIEWHIELTR